MSRPRIREDLKHPTDVALRKYEGWMVPLWDDVWEELRSVTVHMKCDQNIVQLNLH